MLHSFLSSNRTRLIERCRAAAAARGQGARDQYEINHGIPVFIDQLIETLSVEESEGESMRSRSLSGSPSGQRGPSEIGDIAGLHGRELHRQGFTLEQVIRDYGDICQAVTSLACETRAPIEVEEYRTLNRCLDNAVAGAVIEFSTHQAATAAQDEIDAVNSRLGPLAHELRNYLHVAMHAVNAIKSGSVGIAGATGAVLDRSLLGMRNLIDRSIAEVRVTSGLRPRLESMRIADFLREVEAAALLDPKARTIHFDVVPADPDLQVLTDREMLTSALSNLIQNAFKFTQRDTAVRVDASSVCGRVLINVRDHCGGLPSGPAEDLMRPFTQRGTDRSGLGLGLEICRRSIEANNGILRVRDLPGVGCVFTIDLPLHSADANTPELRQDQTG